MANKEFNPKLKIHCPRMSGGFASVYVNHTGPLSQCTGCGFIPCTYGNGYHDLKRDYGRII